MNGEEFLNFRARFACDVTRLSSGDFYTLMKHTRMKRNFKMITFCIPRDFLLFLLPANGPRH